MPNYLVTNPIGERFLIGCDTAERALKAISDLYPDGTTTVSELQETESAQQQTAKPNEQLELF